MKNVILSVAILLMGTVSAAAETTRLDEVSDAQMVAIQRGWNDSQVRCLHAQLEIIDDALEEWDLTENVNKNYLQLRSRETNSTWRCEAKGVRTYHEEDGWGFTSYKMYGW